MGKKILFSFLTVFLVFGLMITTLIVIDLPLTREFRRGAINHHWDMPFWSYQPNCSILYPVLTGPHTIYTEENGYRVAAPDYQIPKTTRIGMVGASNGSGYMLAYENSIVGNLEKILNEPIANASVIGYDTCQILYSLKKIIERFPALEIILISANINDVQHVPHHENSGSLALLGYRATMLSIRFGKILVQQPIANYLIEKKTYSPRVPIDLLVKNLADMENLCRAKGITPIFMTDPLPFHEKYQEVKWLNALNEMKLDPTVLHAKSYNQKIDALLLLQKKHGIDSRYLCGADPEKMEYTIKYEPEILRKPFSIDTNKILKGVLESERLEPEDVFLRFPFKGKFYADHCHPNELGCRLIALEIAKTLSTYWKVRD